MLFFQNFFLFLYDLMQLLYNVLKSFIFLSMRFFVFYPIMRMYIWSISFKVYFMIYIYNMTNEHNKTWNHTSHWCFQSNLISRKCSSALSLITTSILSFFECITHSLSLWLEEIKLIVTVHWNFLVSQFLRLFMMSFKRDLILL